MSLVYRVRYDPAALAALEEAAAFIEEQSGTGRAKAWIAAMRESIERLERLPKAFQIARHLAGRTIYSKLVMSHRVFYLVDDPTQLVYVIDVVHTAQETRLAEYRDP